jgi:hypothetical protein
MAEVKTPPRQARAFSDREEFARQKVPGSIYVGSVYEGKDWEHLWYTCPCGCGAQAPIRVGNGFKPVTDTASWNWNGSLDRPTLVPSVHHVGHWHGWLTDGVWRSC